MPASPVQPAAARTRWRPSGDMGSETACRQLCTGADRRGRLRRRQGSWGYVGRTAIRPRPPGSAFVRSWARPAARTSVNPGLSRPAAQSPPAALHTLRRFAAPFAASRDGCGCVARRGTAATSPTPPVPRPVLPAHLLPYASHANSSRTAALLYPAASPRAAAGH
jgi:hypothetical protein